MDTITREEWLNLAIGKLAPILRDANLALPTVKISVGFPSRKALASSNRRIGECWHHEGIGQENSHIFISPVLSDTIEILGVVIHELLHAALPPKTKHNKTFALAASRCGLEGKPTATTVGDKLRMHLNAILAELPDYPHIAFDANSGKKKQTTRLRLYQCDCGTKVRVAKDDFDATCNMCDSMFIQK